MDTPAAQAIKTALQTQRVTMAALFDQLRQDGLDQLGVSRDPYGPGEQRAHATVTKAAEALGLDTARDLTVTGGMPFAGGPFNNYVLQATARLAALLRAGPARTGLVSSVSGLLTKQGFGLWSSRPAPDGFRFDDVSARVAAATPLCPVVCGHHGPGRVAGWTVLHDRERPPAAIIVADIEGAGRTVAVSDEPALAVRLEAEDFSGAAVVLRDGRFAVA